MMNKTAEEVSAADNFGPIHPYEIMQQPARRHLAHIVSVDDISYPAGTNTVGNLSPTSHVVSVTVSSFDSSPLFFPALDSYSNMISFAGCG